MPSPLRYHPQCLWFALPQGTGHTFGRRTVHHPGSRAPSKSVEGDAGPAKEVIEEHQLLVQLHLVRCESFVVFFMNDSCLQESYTTMAVWHVIIEST